MTRTSDLVDRNVSLELSHPEGGEDGRRAQLRVFDEDSRLMVLSVDIPPQAFYNLLSGLINSDTLPGRMLTAETYTRVGKTRHHVTRKIGYGVTQSDAQAWAEHVCRTRTLDTWSVDSRQGGLWATWELWSDTITENGWHNLTTALEAVPLPDGAR